MVRGEGLILEKSSMKNLPLMQEVLGSISSPNSGQILAYLMKANLHNHNYS